ncbi:MAG: hypothetical protein GX303_05645 [Clostridiales bacterium]|nr:hypothetical protein [Clostridiales bacterium]
MVIDYMKELNLSTGKTKYILVTHTHPDHCSAEAVRTFFAEGKRGFFGSERSVALFRDSNSEHTESASALQPCEECSIADYTLIPIRANHLSAVPPARQQ